MLYSPLMSKKSLTASRLRELLDYDPVTGVFRWKPQKDKPRKWNSRWSGKIAGWAATTGYWMVSIDRRDYIASRLAWLHMTGEWPLLFLDHKDGNRTNNRIENLRPATKAENAQNLKVFKNNTSGFHGVHRSGRRTMPWKSEICTNGRRIHLGRFKTPEEAHAAYLSAKQKHHRFQPTPRDLAS